jgi:hypothetical protein
MAEWEGKRCALRIGVVGLGRGGNCGAKMKFAAVPFRVPRLGFPAAVPFRVPRTNAHPLGGRKRADLSFGEPPSMIAEIKVTGGWNAPKMRYRVEEDVRRMQHAEVGNAERYMILLIRKTDPTRPLAVYLETCDFPGKCERRDWDGFSLKVWRLDVEMKDTSRTRFPVI